MLGLIIRTLFHWQIFPVWGGSTIGDPLTTSPRLMLLMTPDHPPLLHCYADTVSVGLMASVFRIWASMHELHFPDNESIPARTCQR
jgi:hypothetical protein